MQLIGSTIFVHHTGFLPAAIRFHMKLWRLITGKKYTLPWNHVEKVVAISASNYLIYGRHHYSNMKKSDIITWVEVQEDKYVFHDYILMACSARKNGAEMTLLSRYLKDHPVHHIKSPKEEIPTDKIIEMEIYAIDMCFLNPRKYEKSMFLKWIKRIQTLGGYNPKHTDDKQVYCFEIVNEFDKLLGLAPDQDGLVDIYQLWENENFI